MIFPTAKFYHLRKTFYFVLFLLVYLFIFFSILSPFFIYLFIYFCVAFLGMPLKSSFSFISKCLIQNVFIYHVACSMYLYSTRVCVCSCVWWMQRLGFTAIDCNILCKIPSVFSVLQLKRFSIVVTFLLVVLLLSAIVWACCVCIARYIRNAFRSK